MSNSPSLYAVILAGGSGTRLWPRSRKQRPKQLLDLVSDRTMLQETYDRIAPLVGAHNVFVITNQEYVSDVQKQLPFVPHAQIIGEPEGRGTAAPAGLAALLIKQRDPDAVTFILPADHVIPNGDAFLTALVAASEVAQSDYLVTLGISPAYPETGYGYIEASDKQIQTEESSGLEVRRFLEKPNRETAQQFVDAGNYFWNSGIFIWRADQIIKEFARLMPKTLERLETIVRDGLDAPTFPNNWNALENQTLDYGIMEGAERVAMIPLAAGWNDVGSWAALFDLMTHDPDDNAVHGEHIGVNTKSSFIYGNNRLIATIGLENMIVVDTDDAILICSKENAQDVKKIVDELKRRKAHGYL